MGRILAPDGLVAKEAKVEVVPFTPDVVAIVTRKRDGEVAGAPTLRVTAEAWSERTIHLCAPGYERVELRLPPDRGDARVVDLGTIALVPALRITGRVVDADGVALAGFPLEARNRARLATALWDTTSTAEDGRFELGPPSDADVVVAGRKLVAGRILEVGPVEVGRARDVLDLVAVPLPDLVLVVSSAASEPVDGSILVTLSSLDVDAARGESRGTRRKVRLENGRSKWRGLDPGRYRVTVRHEVGEGSCDVTLGDDAETTASIVLRAKGR